MSIVTNIFGTGGTIVAPNSADSVGSGASIASSALAYPATGAKVAANAIPYGGVPNDVLAALTDAGRNLIARSMLEGLAFRIVGFRVGRGGYDPINPLNAQVLNGADVELLDPMWPTILLPPEAIARYEAPNDYGMSFLCRVPSADAIAGIGEFGVYAEILSSPVDPTEVGDTVLFAHMHRPLHGNTLQDVLVWRLCVQF